MSLRHYSLNAMFLRPLQLCYSAHKSTTRCGFFYVRRRCAFTATSGLSLPPVKQLSGQIPEDHRRRTAPLSKSLAEISPGSERTSSLCDAGRRQCVVKYAGDKPYRSLVVSCSNSDSLSTPAPASTDGPIAEQRGSNSFPRAYLIQT